MRTRGTAAVCLTATASVFAGAGPADAACPITPFVSGPAKQGNVPNSMVLDGSVVNGAPVQIWRHNRFTQQNWAISRPPKDETGQDTV